MDTLDTKIIDVLQRDGRASNVRIAKQLGVSEGTVRRRVNGLVRDEYIHVVAFPDPDKMGYESRALVGIRVELGLIDEIVRQLSTFEEVKWVVATTGSFDIFLWVTLRSMEELSIFLHTKIGAIPGIGRAETFMSLGSNCSGEPHL